MIFFWNRPDPGWNPPQKKELNLGFLIIPNSTWGKLRKKSYGTLKWDHFPKKIMILENWVSNYISRSSSNSIDLYPQLIMTYAKDDDSKWLIWWFLEFSNNECIRMFYTDLNSKYWTIECTRLSVLLFNYYVVEQNRLVTHPTVTFSFIA